MGQTQTTPIKLPEAGREGPMGPMGPPGTPGDPLVLLTSPQFSDRLLSSTFYCPPDKDYCSIPKKAVVDFDFAFNKNVGIGTNVPATKLETKGRVRITGAGTTDSGVLELRDGSATSNINYIFTSASDKDLYFQPSGNKDIILQSNEANANLAGRVGIGMNIPSEKLDVNGNVRTTGNLILKGKSTWSIEEMTNLIDPKDGNQLCFKQDGKVKMCVGGTRTLIWAGHQGDDRDRYMYFGDSTNTYGGPHDIGIRNKGTNTVWAGTL